MEPNETTEAPKSLPERICEADMAMLKQAGEENVQGQQIALRCEGALRFVHGLLTVRYALGPEDTFDAEGVIRRKPPAPPEPPAPSPNGVGQGLKDAIARLGTKR